MHAANPLLLSLIAAGVLAQAQPASDSVQSDASKSSLGRTTSVATGTRSSTEAQQPATSGQVPDQQGHPLASPDKTGQLSGVVLDTSGALIAGVGVMVRSADGTVQRTTQSNANGYFAVAGLPAQEFHF